MPDIGRTIQKRIKRGIDALRAFFVQNKHTKQTEGLAMGQVLKAKDAKSIPSYSQVKHFPNLLNKTEKKIAVIAVLIAITAGGILAIQAFNSARIVKPAIGGSYTEGMIGAPQLINPLYSLSSDVDNDLTHLIYSGLMKYDSENGLITDLAQSYEVSEDGTQYTFYLRDDAKWHDGKPVMADDVIFTIAAIQNTEYRSALEVSFRGVTAEQIDEKTIKFTLSEAFAPFLSLLTTGILPSHLWQNINPVNSTSAALNIKPIGSGPYKFEKLVKDSTGSIRSYTLERNEKYYGEQIYIKELNFKFYSDLTSAVEALRNHNIEGIAYLPIQDLPDFENGKSWNILNPAMQQYVALFINQKKAEILSESDIRKALLYATNKSELVETALYGEGAPINSFILPGMLGYDSNASSQTYDLEASKSLLEENGWIVSEETGIRQKNDVNLAFELVTINSTELVETAKVIKEQWRQAGIEVIIRIVNSAEFQSDTLPNRNYDILLAGEMYGIDQDPYAFWHSSQSEFPGLNLAGFEMRSADEYIEEARSTLDTEIRSQAYKSLEEKILSEMPAIFLYQPNYIYAISGKIYDAHLSRIVIPSDRFSTISNWYIKTKKSF